MNEAIKLAKGINMSEVNKNNLQVGDRIMVEEAWEDDAGHYHDEMAEITAIAEDGELSLDFYGASNEVRDFLAGCDSWMANDYKKEI